MRALDALGHALATAGSMTWQITWSLILGFTLSAIVQAVIRRQTITRLLGDDKPRALALALSWQFTLAEFVGGPIMIVLMAVAFRLFVRSRLIDAARQQADKGLAGSMEGHAAMDMSISGGGSFWHRLASRD